MSDTGRDVVRVRLLVEGTSRPPGGVDAPSVDEPADRPGQGAGITGRDAPARTGPLDTIGDPDARADEHREPGSGGLDRRQGARLVTDGGKDQRPRREHALPQVRRIDAAHHTHAGDICLLDLGAQRAVSAQGEGQPRRGRLSPGLQEHLHTLLPRQAPGVQHVVAQRGWVGTGARIGGGVASHDHALRGDPTRGEQGDNALIEHEEGSDVVLPRVAEPGHFDGGRSRGGEHSRVPVAAVPDAGPGVRPDTERAGPAVPEEQPVDARRPEIVQRHHDGERRLGQRPHDSGRQGEPRVVHMDDVGAVPSRPRHHPAGRRHVPHGQRERAGRSQRASRIVDHVLRHLVPPGEQQCAITLDDLILTPGDPVPVVHLQNAHLPATTRRQVVRALRAGTRRRRGGRHPTG